MGTYYIQYFNGADWITHDDGVVEGDYQAACAVKRTLQRRFMRWRWRITDGIGE